MSDNRKLFIIGGVPKAGTTSLFRYMCQSPEITPARIKELKMLDRHDFSADLYWHQFTHKCQFQYCMEATPGYIMAPDTVNSNLKSLNCMYKIAFILRNPSELFYSYFIHIRNNTSYIPRKVTFYEFCEIAQGRGSLNINGIVRNIIMKQFLIGNYFDHLSRYYALINPQDICILFFDDLRTNPVAAMNKLTDFLGISSQFVRNVNYTQENKSRSYKNASLHRFAHIVLMKNEAIINQFPKLRTALKTAYNKINESRITHSSIDNVSKENLDEYYRQNLIETRNLLAHNGYSNFPKWLLA